MTELEALTDLERRIDSLGKSAGYCTLNAEDFKLLNLSYTRKHRRPIAWVRRSITARRESFVLRVAAKLTGQEPEQRPKIYPSLFRQYQLSREYVRGLALAKNSKVIDEFTPFPLFK